MTDTTTKQEALAAAYAADRKNAYAAFRAVWAAGEAELERINKEYPQ